MALCLLCCIVLQLLLLSNAQHYLTVLPVDPVVSIGESIQLNCSINCPLGTVAWKGLDIFINKQYIANGYSVQTLENISMSMEGTKYCEGTCPGYRKAYQKSLQLHVYALPNTLLLSSNMKNGVHYLNCSMELVYPPPEVRCYKGYKMLNEGTDHEALHGDLYNVTWSWVVPEEDWLSDTSYRCEAQVHVNGQVFTREGSLNIFKGKTTTAIPASSPSQITSNLSQKLEAPYLTTTITNSQNPEITQRMPKCSTIISHQTTITGKHTKTASISSVTTQSAQPTTSGLTESNNIGKSTTEAPATSTSQITSTLTQTSEAPYVTTVTTSQNHETTQGKQKSTSIKSHHSTITGEHTKNAIINTVTTQSTWPTTIIGATKSINTDGYYLMWSIVPATGLIGSILLSLHIYRQLSKKGFFQLNHTEFPTVKKGSKSQGGLQAVFCYDISAKKDFSMY